MANNIPDADFVVVPRTVAAPTLDDLLALEHAVRSMGNWRHVLKAQGHWRHVLKAQGEAIAAFEVVLANARAALNRLRNLVMGVSRG